MKVGDNKFISGPRSRVVVWASDWIELIDVDGSIWWWSERVDRVAEPSEEGVSVMTGPEFCDSSASR